jgi:uncharacterized protein involved in exopolysaccharide biosynthesis
MTFSLFLRRYWRIPVLALLTALLAFGASFAEKASYTSTTRLLILDGSTTLLNSTGQPLSSQSAVNESAMAQTLSETQAGLVSSREVATMVVDQLHLDRPSSNTGGPIHWLEGFAASTYAHVRAWITAGFYRSTPRREKAIQTAEANITGSDVAPTGGPDTGQADSFILEISAVGTSSQQAADEANAAANALINVSRQQFEQDSKFYAGALTSQLTNADNQLAHDNQAVSNYEVANNISSLDQQLVQNVQNAGTVASQLSAAQASVEGDKQTVSSLQASLAGIDPSETSDQNIQTGRSTTADDTTQANPVYQTVQDELSQAQATLASDTAKVTSLQGQEQGNSSASLTDAQAGLLDLQQQVTADQNTIQTLSDNLQQAQANEQVSPVSLSRLGVADIPTYPSSPKRYLYLLLGLLLGALAGTWLTYLARRRNLPPIEPADEEESPLVKTIELDLTSVRSGSREMAGVGGRGAESNNGVGDQATGATTTGSVRGDASEASDDETSVRRR